MKSKALHFINYQLISRSKTLSFTYRSARDISTGKISLSYTFNEDDCVDVCVFQFHSRQFARRLAEEMLSYSSAAMSVALVQSYLTKMSYSHTVSHVYYFYILGGVKFTYVVSTTRCIYTCPVSSGMRPRPPPEVV